MYSVAASFSDIIKKILKFSGKYRDSGEHNTGNLTSLATSQSLPCKQSKMFLGPPGSGKTTRLLDDAFSYWESGADVLVLSTWAGSLLSCTKVFKDLQKKATKFKNEVTATKHGKSGSQPNPAQRLKQSDSDDSEKLAKIHFHHYLLYYKDDFDHAITTISKIAETATTCVVMDNAHDGPEFETLCEQLQGMNVIILAAARERNCCTTGVIGTELLVDTHSRPFYNFSQKSEVLDESQMCRFTEILHDNHGEATETMDCFICGQDVAKQLKDMNFGSTDMRYNDLFIIVRNDAISLHRELGFLQGLQAGVRSESGSVRSFTFRFLTCDRLIYEKDQLGEAIEGVASQREPVDVLTMATEPAVRGLERKVVVWLGVKKGDYYDTYDRCNASACATERLVWVRDPHDVTQDDDDDIDDYSPKTINLKRHERY